MTALALSAFIAALIGSGHCAAMCGAFACASADVARESAGRLRAAAGYHGARLAAYVTLGLVAGAVGASVDAAVTIRGIVRPAALIAGAGLVLWGSGRMLALAGVRVPRLPSPGIGNGLIGRTLRGAAHRSPTTRAMLLGTVAPLLPCGWLYAFVASAAATGSPASGGMVMAGFWAGTVPALAAVTLGLHRLLGPARRFVPVATALALIAIGSMTVVRALHADAPLAHHRASVP